MIIDPKTGHSTDRKRLVTAVVEWSSEPPIIASLIRAGRADYQGIAILANIVKATMEETEGALNDKALACAVVAFLVDPTVRATVARYVSTAHGMDFRKAKEELYDLRVELVQQYHLKPSDTPDFVAHEQIVEEPTWVQRYRESDQDVSDEGMAWLRSRTAPVREALVAFPPMSLVRSKEGSPMLFPQPGELAVVQTIIERDGDLVVGLSATPGEMPIAEARVDWIELVATCGKVTSERVKEVLAAE